MPFRIECEVGGRIHLKCSDLVPGARKLVVRGKRGGVDMDVGREVMHNRLYGFGRAVGDEYATGFHSKGRRQVLGNCSVLRWVGLEHALEELRVVQDVGVEMGPEKVGRQRVRKEAGVDIDADFRQRPSDLREARRV